MLNDIIPSPFIPSHDTHEFSVYCRYAGAQPLPQCFTDTAITRQPGVHLITIHAQCPTTKVKLQVQEQ